MSAHEPGGRTFGFIGAGRLGAALASVVCAARYPVAAISRRDTAAAERLASRLGPDTVGTSDPQRVAELADVVFITTTDDHIETTARALRYRAGQIVLHCSGATPLSALRAAQAAGARIGGFHPLQTFPPGEERPSLAGVTVGVEASDADTELGRWLEALTSDLGGRPVRIDARTRPLYHAAAVLAGPLTSALASLAAELWSALGQDREAGRRALAPLFLQTARHFAAHPIPESMTGPFTRGDLEPARAHLEALRRTRPELLRAYASLALAQLPLAAEHGKIAEERMDELRTLLTDAATDEAG